MTGIVDGVCDYLLAPDRRGGSLDQIHFVGLSEGLVDSVRLALEKHAVPVKPKGSREFSNVFSTSFHDLYKFEF